MLVLVLLPVLMTVAVATMVDGASGDANVGSGGGSGSALPTSSRVTFLLRLPAATHDMT